MLIHSFNNLLTQFGSMTDKSFTSFRCLWESLGGPLWLIKIQHYRPSVKTFCPDQPDGPLDLNFVDPEHAAIQQCFQYVISTHLIPSLQRDLSSLNGAVFLLYCLYFTQYPPVSPILLSREGARSLLSFDKNELASNQDVYLCLCRLFTVGAISLIDRVSLPLSVSEPPGQCTDYESLTAFPLDEAIPIEEARAVDQALAAYRSRGNLFDSLVDVGSNFATDLSFNTRNK
ncbi:hypothetical protein GEMRC1_001834 [Eukaryota sp. GEM-RC1]